MTGLSKCPHCEGMVKPSFCTRCGKLIILKESDNNTSLCPECVYESIEIDKMRDEELKKLDKLGSNDYYKKYGVDGS